MGQMATDEPPANPGALLKGSTSNLKHNASDSATTALDMQPPSFAAWSPGPFMTEVNDEQSLHKKVVEFITKMTHVVLRSRIGPLDQLQPPAPSANFREQLAYIDGNALLGHTDFWRNTMPVNLDIFINDTKVLLERWVISHESFPDLAKPHEERFSLKKADLTDLMLLVQSLYSYIRLMPLHAILADSVQLEKRDLRYCVSTADGCSFSPSFDQNGHIHSALLKVLGKAADANGGDSGDDSSGTGRSSRLGSVMSSPQTTLPSVEEDWMTSNYRRSESSDYFGTGSCHSSAASSSPPSSPSAFVPVAFDMSAKLKVYKFKAASTNRGRLHLSVVYDSSVGGLVTPTLTSSRLGTSPVKASPTKPLMKAKESAADNSNAQV
ncbi:uncharacterized protein EV422DRAFT_31380 [Fimicolochytrium jonesii]|uniref:uncharacterized protein n=1 Tax=Fimicolochytrium jonesii TaxID=1396493 RepID=UPI0022FDB4EE|nr:uncharacterized protein EV422DRAFT_31380 [Fimicolochytrium jonesii]KAI8827205.1 hypothetical protein EV422DRAFT_31380 [Fimicolochytrium jonesii]